MTSPASVSARLRDALDDQSPLVTSRDMRRPVPPNPQRGALVTLSGADGSGKSTQARLLVAALRDAGREATVKKYDAGRSKRLGKGLGLLSRESADAATPPYEADVSLLMGADVVNFLWGPVAHAVEGGQVVVVDRYAWDFYITLRVAFGVTDPAITRVLDRAPRPDLAIVLTVAARDASSRITSRSRGRATHPLETDDLLERKCAAYEELARLEGLHAVPTSRSPAQVHQDIWALVRSRGLDQPT